MTGNSSQPAKTRGIQHQVTRAALVSTLGYAVLAGGKYWLGVSFGSFALTADGLHSAVDVLASLVVLGGVAVAAHKSPRFPYGLYKAENLVSLFVALAIFAAGVEIAREAISRGGQAPSNVPVTAAGAFLSMALSYGLGRYKSEVGRRTGSPSMTSEGYHSMTEVFSSLVVLVGIVGYAYGLALDHIAAAVVVVFILYSGWEVLAESIRVLLDEGLDRLTHDRIKTVIQDIPGVAAVNFLAGRSAGRLQFVEASVALMTGSLVRAHAITEEIESEVRRRFPNVERVVVHAEPQAMSSPGTKVAVPVLGEHGPLTDGLGNAPEFLIALMGEGGPVEVQVARNPFADAPRRRGLSVARWLLANGVNVLVTRDGVEDKAPGLALANAGVRIVVTGETSVEGALRDLRRRDHPRSQNQPSG